MLLLDPVREFGHLVVDGAALGHQLTNLPVRVHDGGVVAAAELLADLGQAHVVSSRHRYIAICRAVTSTRERDDPQRSSIVRPKSFAVWVMIVAAVISAVSSSVMR